jgi:hypothetical protein
MPDTLITFEHVEVMRANDLGWWCRIDELEVFVGRNVPQAGTTVRLKGDHGRLVLPRWFVEDHRLPAR